MPKLIQTNVAMITYSTNVNGWNQPFNKCVFINLDPSNSVFINLVEVKPGLQLSIPLNIGEVNITNFTFDFRGSATALLQIIYTKYENVDANQLDKWQL